MNRFFQLVQTYLAEEASRQEGHLFIVKSFADSVVRCDYCEQPEALVTTSDGTLAPCTGLAGYGDDTERVYLLLTTASDAS